MINCFLTLCVFITFLYIAECGHITFPQIGRDGSVGLLADHISSNWSSLATAESGYDFTEEEMKKFKIWPNGVVPYLIDEYSFDEQLTSQLHTFLTSVYGVTGVRFNPLPRPPEDPQERWILLINRKGQLPCEDYTTDSFTNEGVQKIVIGYDCPMEEAKALSTLLAVLGVPPQHNSPDRDEFIRIEMDNVLPEKRSLLEKISRDQWPFTDIEYDYSSAGHYDYHKFTSNGMATIIPKKNLDYGIGESNGLSYLDLQKIRRLYNHVSKNQLKPDCSKLYEPSSNFKNYQPSIEDEIAPKKLSKIQNKNVSESTESDEDTAESEKVVESSKSEENNKTKLFSQSDEVFLKKKISKPLNIGSVTENSRLFKSHTHVIDKFNAFNRQSILPSHQMQHTFNRTKKNKAKLEDMEDYRTSEK